MFARFLIAALLASVCGCSPARQYFAPDDPSLPFSSAVLSGDTLYVSGHLGLDPATGTRPDAAADEAAAMLDRFAATLARAEMGMDDLVQVQVFCSDTSLYSTFNDVYRARFGSFPARAFIGSGQLLKGCRFEMLGVAVRR